jgi:hypothetical protein
VIARKAHAPVVDPGVVPREEHLHGGAPLRRARTADVPGSQSLIAGVPERVATRVRDTVAVFRHGDFRSGDCMARSMPHPGGGAGLIASNRAARADPRTGANSSPRARALPRQLDPRPVRDRGARGRECSRLGPCVIRANSVGHMAVPG